MKLIVALSVVAVVASISPARAAGALISADAGYSRLSNGGADALGGYGLDVTAGYDLGGGFVPELLVGVHNVSTSVDILGTSFDVGLQMIPAMVGARYLIQS